MTDKVSEIKEYHRTRSTSAQARVGELYQSLAPKEGRELAAYAIELIDRQDEQEGSSADDILLHLACLTPGALDEVYQELVNRQILYPGIIFRDAGPETSRQLLNLVPATQLQADHLLTALAWVGNSHVREVFHRWRKTPPDWAASLHISPDAYAQVAGWTLTPEAQRRDLFHMQCYPLTRFTDDADCLKSPVQVAEAHEGHCPWCARELTTLFDLDLMNPALSFLEIDGTRLRVATCLVCTCYSIVYAKVDWNGKAEWSTHNRRPHYLPDDSLDWPPLPSKRLVLGETTRSPYSAASYSVSISFSQVGGHPTWIQDFSYPACPECDNPMDFIAQLANADIEEYGQGIYYAFLCQSCQHTCTCYQQT